MECIQEEETNNDIFRGLGTHHDKSLKKAISSINKTFDVSNKNSSSNSIIKQYKPVL